MPKKIVGVSGYHKDLQLITFMILGVDSYIELPRTDHSAARTTQDSVGLLKVWAKMEFVVLGVRHH